MGLDELALASDGDNPETIVGDRRDLEELTGLIQELKPADRQVVVLYLEGLDAASISEITGLSEGAVAVKVHRLKAVLARLFNTPGDAR